MAHITTSTINNADAALEATTLAAKGEPVYINTPQPATDNSGKKREGVTEDLLSRPEPPQYYGEYTEEGDPLSAGTSSSTSEKTPDKSGSSALETGLSLQLPAPIAESHFSQDPASRQAPFSTAPSTSGSTQETGLSQPDQLSSSVEPRTEPASGTEATAPLSGRELIQQARQAYDAKDWAAARQLLEDARQVDPSTSDEVDVALQAVQVASEQIPSDGGFLVP
jgi:hypothetical protein